MSEIANPTESTQTNNEHETEEARTALYAILDDLANVKYDIGKAASAGSRLASAAPLSLLLPLLRDKNPTLRFAAVEALRLGDFEFSRATIDTLLSRIDDRQTYIATASIKALGRKRIVEAEEELVSCLDMEESRIAAAALLALCEIGTAPIDEYVKKFMDSADPIRIRAAATVVARRKLIVFGETMLKLVQELRAKAEIVPHSDRVNHYLVAIRSMILALDVLQYREAIPELKELGVHQIGLRSTALRTLHHMGVDVADVARSAHETYPSAKIAQLLSDIINDFEGGDAALDKLNQFVSDNCVRLNALGGEFAEGTRTSGKAVKVSRAYAIVQLEQGMSAYMPAAEYRWLPTNDLMPFESRLFETGQYEVIEVDREQGRIKVSRRKLRPDPWQDLQTRLKHNQTIRGKIDRVVNFGLFVELESEIVGLLHISRLNLPQGTTAIDAYRVGDPIDVIVENVDLKGRRIRLDLK